MLETHQAPDRAILLQALEPKVTRDACQRLLDELVHLSTTAGLEVHATQLLSLQKAVPATYFGSGQVEELARRIEEDEIDVAVVNHALTPIQQRNLEKKLNAKVVDRTGLILEIFAARARTREGIMQVELASLMYQQSRLVRSWTHLERQRGGVGLRGGPGERQIEVDRRLIRERIHKLKKQLEEVERTRALQRQPRQDIPLFTVALVGYTNAGKSTLFNLLTRAGVLAEDKLFATLDPTMRAVDLPDGGRILLSDTVGFIRQLPHQLVAAFKATLEEVMSADMLLHVVDLSDPEWERYVESVNGVLQELEVQHTRTLTVYNKIDRLESRGILERELARGDTIGVSAQTGEGVEPLLSELRRAVGRAMLRYEVILPVSDGRWLAKFHAEASVVEVREGEDFTTLIVELAPAVLGRLQGEVEREGVEVQFRPVD
ncbi:GTP-binding protein, HSR1-related protein [Magnetococcus marinus MC-1]|uniref:GTPase HflX n=1 Tax=Magnetococcus marinus (strain ATCC BAA-1437 / JCM 17883 / MC-1) TaxID=156889 RepID=HFLX_MAGMM|nr:GTPase HflX [Magnetococcus marinus]A0L4B2.1 RecName: Full=GTPase HflX; AltName: Full=GTP-binding protein HflX [Magnetococcus marinus MC-1]ABK42805.1 GTP-binding protein, HSR1-related protein [Magnetococcus marinus MC-1]